MTVIESQEVSIDKDQKEVIDFLSDLSNYAELMPDRIKSWEVNGDVADVYIEGLGKYQIQFEEKTDSGVVLSPVGSVPVNFTININTRNLDNSTAVKGEIHAKLNMMMKMMAQKPLQEMIDVQVTRLKEKLS
jgi:carbon monoxide dehydrogenase subunit G